MTVFLSIMHPNGDWLVLILMLLLIAGALFGFIRFVKWLMKAQKENQ